MVLTLLALLPALVPAIWIYRQDKVEKEPIGLLLKIFFFGALSVIPTAILEFVLGEVFLLFLEKTSLVYILLENFVVVALVEEFCKMEAAKLAAWKHRAFNYKFDAIVYCVISALGFAAVENVLYVLDGDLSTAVTRALLSIPSHAIDGLIMGYFFGMAKDEAVVGNRRGCRYYLRLSVLIPAIEHGIYDMSLSLDNDWVLLFFFAFVIAVDIWAIIFARKQSKKDRAFPGTKVG